MPSLRCVHDYAQGPMGHTRFGGGGGKERRAVVKTKVTTTSNGHYSISEQETSGGKNPTMGRTPTTGKIKPSRSQVAGCTIRDTVQVRGPECSCRTEDGKVQDREKS